MIKLTFDNGLGDLGTDSDGLTEDSTLTTAVLMSLLSDARALPEESLDATDLGGWWGDTYPEFAGDQIGSKLWLLANKKTTTKNLKLAEGYAESALTWLQADGIADGVSVAATRLGADVLELEILIDRPDLPADLWLGTWQATIEGA